MSARLIIICLDGADGRMLDQYSSDGSLPNLSALRLRGATRLLAAPLGSTDDALWASFQYMVPADEHGRYHYLIPQEGGQIGMSHENERLPALWDALSRQGMQVAVLDVPKCRAPGPMNGIQIVDWLTHGEYFASPRSFPASLADEVLREFGVRPPHECGYLEIDIDRRDPGHISAKLLTEISMKCSAGVHYLNSRNWDLFCIGFSQLHCLHHKFWSFDRTPAIDDLRACDETTFQVLRAIDQAVGTLIASAGSSADRLVLAPTDFERNGSLDHLMPEVVARINRRLLRKFRRCDWLDRSFRALSKVFLKRPPDSWPCAILPYAENFLALRVAARGADELYRSASSALPDEALLGAIEREFLDLRDDVSGTRLISAIARPSRVGQGRAARNLPDLLIQYPSGHFPSAVRSDGIGRVAKQSPSYRKGNHRDGGFVLASGARCNALLPEVQTIADIGSLAEQVLA